MIVIPAIDLRGGKVVRLTEGDPDRETIYDADPVAVAMRFEAQGAHWLHVVDLDAALGGQLNTDTIGRLSAEVSARLQVGGGLRTAEAIRAVIQNGADRVVLGSKATDTPFLRSMLDEHGECVVVAVDVREGRAMLQGWKEVGPSIDEFIPQLDAAGCHRYLVTAIAADGKLEGPDLDLYQRVLGLTDRPVLASGGVTTVDDLRTLSELGVEGAIVGKALYEGTLSLADALQAVAP